MFSVTQARERLGVVVPVYFDPVVSEKTILIILQGVFRDSELFCRPDRLLAVVDRNTQADELLTNPPKNSNLTRIPICRLERNRAKAGAVEMGLRQLLETTDADYFVTRDCDGDHILEDIPRMVTLADEVRGKTGKEAVVVMGARPSLEKPMGWLRQEWEFFTNRILVGMVSYVMARRNMVIDRRFWNGAAPDLQSGYRAFSRTAAEQIVECLAALPEQREVLTLACEAVSFAELLLKGGVFAQMQRSTLVEQPVSSYSQVNFGDNYGRLISFLGSRYRIPGEILLRIVDNEIVGQSMYFTEFRDQLLLFRRLIAPHASPPELPSFV